jgi:hypothetical protein
MSLLAAKHVIQNRLIDDGHSKIQSSDKPRSQYTKGVHMPITLIYPLPRNTVERGKVLIIFICELISLPFTLLFLERIAG